MVKNGTSFCLLASNNVLVFSRILCWKPRFAVLDEATSSIDKDTEEYLYRTLIGFGTTVIIISHRPKIIELYNTLARLNRQGGYTAEEKKSIYSSLVAV